MSSSISTTLDINNCDLTDPNIKQTEKQNIGTKVSHSVRVSQSEKFDTSVSINAEASLDKIIGGAKVKLGTGLKWDATGSQVSTGNITQSEKYELDTSGVGIKENVMYSISYSYVPAVNLPFISKNIVQAKSNGQAVENPDLITILLEDTGSTCIINNEENTNVDGYTSGTYIVVEIRGILTSTGTSGEFNQVTVNIPCPTETEQPSQNHEDL